MTKSVMVLNGPNLNLLGTHEPELYGSETLASIEAACQSRGKNLGLSVDFRQSNTESDLVDWMQEAAGTVDSLIINAGNNTQTSEVILDALLTLDIPVIEVHQSNINQGEENCHHSYISKAANGMICGLGGMSYELALESLAHSLGTLKET